MLARAIKVSVRIKLVQLATQCRVRQSTPYRQMILDYFNMLLGDTAASVQFWTVDARRMVLEKFGGADDDHEWPLAADGTVRRDFSRLIYTRKLLPRIGEMMGCGTGPLRFVFEPNRDPWMPGSWQLAFLGDPMEGILRRPFAPWTMQDIGSVKPVAKDSLSIAWYAAKAQAWRASHYSLYGANVSPYLERSIRWYAHCLRSCPAMAGLCHEAAMTHYFLFLQDPDKHYQHIFEEAIPLLDRALRLVGVDGDSSDIAISRARVRIAFHLLRERRLLETHELFNLIAADCQRGTMAQVPLLVAEARKHAWGEEGLAWQLLHYRAARFIMERCAADNAMYAEALCGQFHAALSLAVFGRAVDGVEILYIPIQTWLPVPEEDQGDYTSILLHEAYNTLRLLLELRGFQYVKDRLVMPTALMSNPFVSESTTSLTVMHWFSLPIDDAFDPTDPVAQFLVHEVAPILFDERIYPSSSFGTSDWVAALRIFSRVKFRTFTFLYYTSHRFDQGPRDLSAYVIPRLRAPELVTTYQGPNNETFALLASHCKRLRKVVFERWDEAESGQCFERLISPSCPLLEDIEFGYRTHVGSPGGFASTLSRHAPSLSRLAMDCPLDLFKALLEGSSSFEPLTRLREIRLASVTLHSQDEEDLFMSWASSWAKSPALWNAHLEVTRYSTGRGLYQLASMVSHVWQVSIPAFDLEQQDTQQSPPLFFDGVVVFNALGTSSVSSSVASFNPATIQKIAGATFLGESSAETTRTFRELKVLYNHPHAFVCTGLRYVELDDSFDAESSQQLVLLPNLKAFVMKTLTDMGPHVWAWVDPLVCRCRLEHLEFRCEVLDGPVNLWLFRLLKLHSSLENLLLERTCFSEDAFILPTEPHHVQQEMMALVNRVRRIQLMSLWDFIVPRFLQWLESNFRFRKDPVDDSRPLCRVQIGLSACGRGVPHSMHRVLTWRGMESDPEIDSEPYSVIFHSAAMALSNKEVKLPRSVQRAMRTLLLCHSRSDCLLHRVPKDVLFNCIFSWILRVY